MYCFPVVYAESLKAEGLKGLVAEESVHV